MAKTRKTPKNLSPDDQVKYDALPPNLKAVVDDITDLTQKTATIRALSAQAAATTPTVSTGGATAFQGGSTAPTETFFEQAIGVEAGRRVSLGTQQVVPGTVTRVGGVGGFLPRYFERDVDLLSRYTRDQVADIQARMQKAGLLGKNYRVGIPDPATKKAWAELLSTANNTNTDWTTALGGLVANPTGGKGKLPPRVSNPADIKKVVQQVAGRILGRSADQQTVDAIVRQFQASQVASQTNALPVAKGSRVEPMELQTLAEQKIMKRQGAEAEAYRFAQFASRLFGEASEGVPTEMGQVQP